MPVGYGGDDRNEEREDRRAQSADKAWACERYESYLLEKLSRFDSIKMGEMIGIFELGGELEKARDALIDRYSHKKLRGDDLEKFERLYIDPATAPEENFNAYTYRKTTGGKEVIDSIFKETSSPEKPISFWQDARQWCKEHGLF